MTITHTPLKLATQYGHIDAMNLLISKGANLDTKYRSRHYSLVHIAAINNQEHALKLLINTYGMNIDETDMYGATSLHNAASSNNIAAIILLLDNGAYINARERYNNFTPLQWAIECGMVEAIELLIDRGANTDVITEKGKDIFIVRNIHEITSILHKIDDSIRCYCDL